ncbi:hypothetical protein GCM10010372_18090 [Streptomyces tauricus]|nr:hypothetical protein GCM10010372_18090 [Streptomyces tauricus]
MMYRRCLPRTSSASPCLAPVIRKTSVSLCFRITFHHPACIGRSPARTGNNVTPRLRRPRGRVGPGPCGDVCAVPRMAVPDMRRTAPGPTLGVMLA